MKASEKIDLFYLSILIKPLKTLFKLSISSIPLICIALLSFDLPAGAEGSRDMYPQASQGNRGNILWTTKTWGSGFYERTLLRVFARKNEYILMGSSAIGVNNGDILLYKPGRITGDAAKESIPGTADFSCQKDQLGRGKIQNRTEELAGAKPVSGADNPNGYTPCYYQATETGVYYIAMYGPVGSNSSNNGDAGVEPNIENINTNSSQDTGISAWDVTVRSSDLSTTDITGRLFTFVLSINMGDNGRQLHSNLYPVTVDGYRYELDIRGLDPFTFRIFGNQVGNFNSDGKTPLYGNVLGEDGGVSNPEGGVTTAPPQFPIFFNQADENALDYITQYNTKGQIISSGISRFPVPPEVSNPNFTGSVLGDTSEVSDGGNFTFDTTNSTGIYEIVLSHDGSNFDPTHPLNRVLRGVINQSGRQTAYWNSRDNSGNFVPVGTYTYKISVHAGEYHFPISDAENNYYGGPTITLLNAIKPPPLGPTTTFFDDRGYVTINGTQVGNPNQPLCGVNPPNPAYSNPINGADSSAMGFRTFGTASGGNANRKCGSNSGNVASFGDTKTLDTWTFVPSPPAIKQLEIVDAKIAGNIYEDIDREDDFDKGQEPVLPKNITINLLDNNGNLIGNTATDSNGFYAFTGLMSGNYKVEVDTSDSDIPEVYILGTKKTVDVAVTIDKTAVVNFGFDRKEGLCDLGGGVNDSTVNPYISAEVTNNSANSRQLTDSLDDDWRTAATGISGGTVQPWFGNAHSLGSVNNFSYIDPVTDNTISTTVELVEVPIDGASECEGLTKTSSSTPQLGTSTTLQESSPRPASLYNTSNQPAFWNQTSTPQKDGRRFAVRFNFNTPVKSFGAWFGDLETRSEYATPAILRLLDASGNRIGKDITIEPTQLYDGSSSNPQIINQIQCGSSASDTGCGNKSTRWIGFIDNFPVPRVTQALVIVGDDDFEDNGDTEILSFIGANVISNYPNVLLVKRITAINGGTATQDGDDLAIYNQDDNNYYDDNEIEGRNLPTQPRRDTDKWLNTISKSSSTFLIGGINGGKVKPNDELEYTVYYLSAGEIEANNVLFCDRIPEELIFIPNSFNNETNQATGGLQNSDRGIQWLKNGNTESLTNVKDGDAAQYFPPRIEPDTVYPTIKCNGANINGAIVVNLGNLPNATAPGTPNTSYGFVRFRAKVK